MTFEQYVIALILFELAYVVAIVVVVYTMAQRERIGRS